MAVTVMEVELWLKDSKGGVDHRINTLEKSALETSGDAWDARLKMIKTVEVAVNLLHSGHDVREMLTDALMPYRLDPGPQFGGTPADHTLWDMSDLDALHRWVSQLAMEAALWRRRTVAALGQLAAPGSGECPLDLIKERDQALKYARDEERERRRERREHTRTKTQLQMTEAKLALITPGLTPGPMVEEPDNDKIITHIRDIF